MQIHNKDNQLKMHLARQCLQVNWVKKKAHFTLPITIFNVIHSKWHIDRNVRWKVQILGILYGKECQLDKNKQSFITKVMIYYFYNNAYQAELFSCQCFYVIFLETMNLNCWMESLACDHIYYLMLAFFLIITMSFVHSLYILY